jgi:hypothetical protein
MKITEVEYKTTHYFLADDTNSDSGNSGIYIYRDYRSGKYYCSPQLGDYSLEFLEKVVNFLKEKNK